MSNHRNAELARQLLDLDEGELRPREKAVIHRAMRRLAVSTDVDAAYQKQTAFGQHLADRVAGIGGSWGFIIVLGVLQSRMATKG